METPDKPKNIYNKVSDEKRQAIIRACTDIDTPVSKLRAAEIFNVGYRTVCKIIQEYNDTGKELKSPKGGNRKRIMSDMGLDLLKGLI